MTSEWTNLITNFGLPTAILVVLCFALWRGGIWLTRTVVEPVVKSHLELVEVLSKRFPEQCSRLQALVDMQKEIQKALQDQTIILKRTIETQTTDLRRDSHGPNS